MKRAQFMSILKALLTHPTAPFMEHAVRSQIQQYLRGAKISFGTDTFGNTIARVRRGMPRRKVAFMAAIDHPAFEVVATKGNTLQVSAHGAFGSKSLKGAKLVFTGSGAKAVIASSKNTAGVLTATATLAAKSAPAARGDMGILDIPAVGIKGTRIRARSGRGLFGAASVLATLLDLAESNDTVEAWGIFTCGSSAFSAGTTGMLLEGKLPRELLVLAVEGVAATAQTALGKGPVARLGDRLGPLHPGAYASLVGAAESLGKKVPVQYAVVSDSQSEAAPFVAHGYVAASVGVPVHAIGNAAARAVAPEEADARDLEGTLALLRAVAMRAGAGVDDVDLLRNQLIRLGEDARERAKAAAPHDGVLVDSGL